MAAGYPVFLNVDQLRCLVIGTGREAEEKSAALAECGAVVERHETYTPGSLAGFFLVISAGPDRSQNAAIFAEAEAAGILVNCLDDPPHCRFTFASVLRQGDLVIAISTSGACPALAVRLRERLQSQLGPEYAEFLSLARDLRQRLAEAVPDFQQRKQLWYSLVDSDLLEQLRQGDRDAAEQPLRAILPPPALD